MLAVQNHEDAWKARTQKAMERLNYEASTHASMLDIFHKKASNIEPSRELNRKAVQIFTEAEAAFKLYTETTKKRRFIIEGIDEATNEIATFDIPSLNAIKGDAEALMPVEMPDLDDGNNENPAKRIRTPTASNDPAASSAMAAGEEKAG